MSDQRDPFDPPRLGGLLVRNPMAGAAGWVSPVAGYNRLYDATDSTTVTVSGGKATQIADKSGNAVTLTNTTALNQPAYNLASVNGLNTLGYTGSQMLIGTNKPDWIYLHNAAATVFVVFKQTSVGTNDCLWGTNLNDNSSQIGTMMKLFDFTAGLDFWVNVRGTAGAVVTGVHNSAGGNRAAFRQAWSIGSVILDPTNGTAASRETLQLQNSTASSSTADNAATGAVTASNPDGYFNLGNGGATVTTGDENRAYFTGEIGLFVSWASALSGANQTSVANSLQTYFAI